MTIGAGTTITVSTNNSLTRDLGSLKITKSVTGDIPPSFSQTFNFRVLCSLTDSPDLTYDLSIDYPTATFVTQGNIPTGYSCAVTEGARTDIQGYTWGTPIIADNPAVIAAKNTEYTVAVENPISLDKGMLTIRKTLDDGGSGFNNNFTIHYDCGTAGWADVILPAGGYINVGPFLAGTVCTITEPTLPTPPLITAGTNQ